MTENGGSASAGSAASARGITPASVKETEDWYRMPFEVRDYEVDLQGIVNNANYFHYFEHARNVFGRERGFDLSDLHDNQGIDPVVSSIEIKYRIPLRPRERFTVRVRAHREGRIRIVFEERLIKEDGSDSASAFVVVALLKGSRPIPVDDSVASALEAPEPPRAAR